MTSFCAWAVSWTDVGIPGFGVIWEFFGVEIEAIAPAGTLKGIKTIDAAGRYISPGFIDIHTHSDLSILINPCAESAVRQGVTTHVIGNCGLSPAPINDDHLFDMRQYWGSISDQPEVKWGWRAFDQYLQAIERSGTAINIASLAGHCALRISVMGLEDRLPSASELERMKELLSEAMRSGAFGLSTGLVYPPGCFSNTQELVALSRVVSQYHGLYASHIRGERETILDAIAEAIFIGKEANIPVQISHNAPKFGAPCDARGSLQLLEEARAHGQDVTADNDVHTDLAPALIEGLPQHIQDKSIQEKIALLSDPSTRQQIRQEIVDDKRPAFGPAGLLKHAQWHRITILNAPNTPIFVGKTIEKIAQERQEDPFDAYFDLIIENGVDGAAIFDYIDESNIRILLQNPAVMICSDSEALAPYGYLNTPPPYNPCSYGEFPGVLERYVRQKKVLTLEEAVRKMTSFPLSRKPRRGAPGGTPAGGAPWRPGRARRAS